MNREGGFGLIEVMIALTVGLILTAGIVKVLSSSGNANRLMAANSEIQETGRLVVTLLQSELRNAGYFGCSSLRRIEPTVNVSATPAVPVEQPVSGFEGKGSYWSPIPPSLPNTLIKGSDVIHIQGATRCDAFTRAAMSGPDDDISIEYQEGCLFSTSTVGIISTCYQADIFKVTGITDAISNTLTLRHAATHNTGDELSIAYPDGSRIAPFSSSLYYVDRSYEGSSPGLWRMDAFSGTAEELVPNVHGLAIRYGVDRDDDGDPDIYLTGDAVTDWSNAVSASVEVLVGSTNNNIALKPQDYRFNGADHTATDKRIYRVFRTTVSFRN